MTCHGSSASHSGGPDKTRAQAPKRALVQSTHVEEDSRRHASDEHERHLHAHHELQGALCL